MLGKTKHHASAYLGSKQPGKADQVLSKVLECYGSVVGDLAAVGDAEDGAAAVDKPQMSEAPPFGTDKRSLQEGYSTARCVNTVVDPGVFVAVSEWERHPG